MNPPEVIVSIAGMLTGLLVTAAICFSGARILTGPVGQALARRIAGKGGQADADLMNEVGALRSEVDQLHQRLLDTEERLDFSERLLAQRNEPQSSGRLP